MNDRFKFRIYLKAHNKMCDVHTLHSGTNKVIVSSRYGNCSVQMNEYNILMQCTGLKDKNGKLIYEGDILNKTKVDWKYEEYTLRYVVCWDRTQWQLGLLKWQRPKAQNNRRYDRKIPFKDIVTFDCYTPMKEFAECEIIGNVYENKELLNESFNNLQNLFKCVHYTRNENMNKTCRNEKMCKIYYDEECKEYENEKHITNNNSSDSDSRNLHN